AELRRQRAGLRPVGGGRGQREGRADETGLPRGLRLRLGLLRLKLGLRLVLGLALALGLTLALRLALALGLCLVGRRQFRRLGQRA
ncbi:hypothetical protein KN815_49540, partial [Streptomyces sp. 4503]